VNFSEVISYHASRSPLREALKYQGRSYTYKEMDERINACAKVLKDLGVKKGDRVALLLQNCVEFIETVIATNRIGAVFLPLNYRLAAEEFIYILNDAGAKVLVSEKQYYSLIDAIRKEIGNVGSFISVNDSSPPEGWLGYHNLLEKNLGVICLDEEANGDDLRRLMYTSGTTSRPKGVMITYNNLFWKCFEHIIELNLTRDERLLVVGPLYHVGGLDLPGIGVFILGGSIVLMPRFDVIPVLETIERERPTGVWLAPAMINMILNEPRAKEFDLSSIRFIIDGGEKMPEALINKVLDIFPSTWFADAYGLTETVSGDTFLDKGRTISKLGSVGKPVLFLKMRIVDDNDQDVPPNMEGEIVFRGPKVFAGYWNNEEATAEAFRGGWFHTGDIGRVDDEGFLYIVDRKKDIIISGGENIASLEVERVIYQHPSVKEVAVVGIPDKKWGEIPKAYIVLKEGSKVEPQEIIDLCKEKLAKFKIPKQVEFIDVLPRNPSGKVLKRALKAHGLEGK
jgi:O-succinylbenzoate-CoA ligase